MGLCSRFGRKMLGMVKVSILVKSHPSIFALAAVYFTSLALFQFYRVCQI